METPTRKRCNPSKWTETGSGSQRSPQNRLPYQRRNIGLAIHLMKDNLMCHVDYMHQANKSMYDRIKFIRAKEKEDCGSSSKDKGKGEGKKSFETKPVRKEQIQTR